MPWKKVDGSPRMPIQELIDDNGRRWVRLLAGHSVAVLPVCENGDIWLVRQWRAGADSELWEAPGGMIEAGETPAEAAIRELREETGLETTNLELWGECWKSPGISTEKVYLYLAHVKEERGEQRLDDGERIECVSFTLTGIAESIKAIKCLATLTLVTSMAFAIAVRLEVKNGKG